MYTVARDEADRSGHEREAREAERERERLGLRGGRKARPPKRGCSGYRRGGAAGTGEAEEVGVRCCVQRAQ